MGSVSNNAPVIMDARKFVRAINNGASAKLKFFEESVSRLGKEIGKDFRLTSLDVSTLIFEDAAKGEYFLADIKKVGNGRVSIENVRPIQVVEEEKAEQFGKNVQELVEHIATGNFKEADKTFGRIESQRYRSHVIPESGMITTRDGVARRVHVSSRSIRENHVPVIIKLFCEAVQDKVEVDQGMVVRGVFNETQERFTIPVNEYTRRRLIARTMRDLAENAHKSGAFQGLVHQIATLVAESKIPEAIKVAAKFLAEEQEFCMLDQKAMTTLVENALASRCQFNSMLAADTASLMYKTNLKVNRDHILEAWSKTAQKAENANLLSNVKLLGESKEFDKDYNEFLDVIFNESADIGQARARAYLNSLKLIASVLPSIESEDESKGASLEELSALIAKLEKPEPDTASILQAEQLLTGINDSLIDRISSLEAFDNEPGEIATPADEGADEKPVPLPEMGGDEEEAPAPAPTTGAGAAGAAPTPPPLPESKTPTSTPVESMTTAQLKEELEDWKLEGASYIKEDKADNCAKQFDRYIKRCLTLGPAADSLREQFEGMRQTLLETGDDVIVDNDDSYAASAKLALENVEAPAAPTAGGLKKDHALETELHAQKKADQAKLVSVKPGTAQTGVKESRNQKGALAEDLAAANPRTKMGADFQGTATVQDTRNVSADGRKGDGVKPAPDYKAQGGLKDKGLRMDEFQGEQVVQDGGVHDVTGRDGSQASSAEDYTMPGNKLKSAGSLRMDDQQGAGVVSGKGVDKSDGRTAGRTAGGRNKFLQVEEALETGTKPAQDYTLSGGDMKGKGLRMDDLQGSSGVQGKSVASADGRKGDGAKPAPDYTMKGGLKDAPGGVGATDELQGNKSVQAKSLTAADGRKGDGAKAAPDYTQKGGMKGPAGGPASMDELQGKGGVAEAITPENIARLIEEEFEAEDESVEDESATEETPTEDAVEAETDAGPEVDGGDLPPTTETPAEAPAAPMGTVEAAQVAAAAATAAAVAANAVVKTVTKHEQGEGDVDQLPPEVADSMPEEDSEAPAEEAPAEESETETEEPAEVEEGQYKGPSRKDKGSVTKAYARGSRAPVKESKNAKPLNENTAVVISSDPIDSIIASVVSQMEKDNGGGLPGDMMGDMGAEAPAEAPVPPAPPAPEAGGDIAPVGGEAEESAPEEEEAPEAEMTDNQAEPKAEAEEPEPKDEGSKE